jgi:hypothetical protein
MNFNYIYIVHILAGLFFIYLGLNNTIKHNVLYNILLTLSVIIFLYHLYRLWSKYNNYVSYVNIFHVVLLAPLLCYIGVVKGKGVYPSNELLVVLGTGITTLFLLKVLELN